MRADCAAQRLGSARTDGSGRAARRAMSTRRRGIFGRGAVEDPDGPRRMAPSRTSALPRPRPESTRAVDPSGYHTKNLASNPRRLRRGPPSAASATGRRHDATTARLRRNHQDHEGHKEKLTKATSQISTASPLASTPAGTAGVAGVRVGPDRKPPIAEPGGLRSGPTLTPGPREARRRQRVQSVEENPGFLGDLRELCAALCLRRRRRRSVVPVVSSSRRIVARAKREAKRPWTSGCRSNSVIRPRYTPVAR